MHVYTAIRWFITRTGHNCLNRAEHREQVREGQDMVGMIIRERDERYSDGRGDLREKGMHVMRRAC